MRSGRSEHHLQHNRIGACVLFPIYAVDPCCRRQHDNGYCQSVGRDKRPDNGDDRRQNALEMGQMSAVFDLRAVAAVHSYDFVLCQLRLLRGIADGDERSDNRLGGVYISAVGGRLYRWRYSAVGSDFADDRGGKGQAQAAVPCQNFRRYRRGYHAVGDAACRFDGGRLDSRTDRDRAGGFRRKMDSVKRTAD